jgi:hypothetical protein
MSECVFLIKPGDFSNSKAAAVNDVYRSEVAGQQETVTGSQVMADRRCRAAIRLCPLIFNEISSENIDRKIVIRGFINVADPLQGYGSLLAITVFTLDKQARYPGFNPVSSGIHVEFIGSSNIPLMHIYRTLRDFHHKYAL